jgi:hypothetical protein
MKLTRRRSATTWMIPAEKAPKADLWCEQDGAALEMAAEPDQCEVIAKLESIAAPKSDARIEPHHPLPIFFMQVDWISPNARLHSIIVV